MRIKNGEWRIVFLSNFRTILSQNAKNSLKPQLFNKGKWNFRIFHCYISIPFCLRISSIVAIG
ncbi:MAG: hypothetical protein LBR36_00765, partial [Bacteroidales bacterium]|nr:hypothetical protein [Bacteroidales bacterium]